MTDRPKTQYAKTSDGTHIAYQVVGNGPIDLVYVPSWVSHIEWAWEDPNYAHFLTRLGSFSRLIWFDKRGTGLSDRASRLPILDEQMDDVTAVMDAVGSKRAALFGHGDGGTLCAVLAASHPERVSALIVAACSPRFVRADDYPWGVTPELMVFLEGVIEEAWGRFAETEYVSILAPSAVDDSLFLAWFDTLTRLGASPSAAIELMRIYALGDIRAVLPTISVPTLVLQRSEDPLIEPAHGQYFAEHVPGATYVEIPGRDYLINVGDVDRMADEIQHFLTGVRGGSPAERILATVMFTDIVGSTEWAVSLGDARWRELLDAHDALIRRQLARFRGHEVKTLGDGFMATFDGPARAIECATAISDGVRGLGIEIRTGIHTGEVEVRGDDIGGIAVHLAKRVESQATPGDVLVSRTVVDLVAGSTIEFEDRGQQELKGVPGTWRLYAVKA
jgi:class 3 adenylate cyclase/alpha-beta hydrolase superfamily lysophospholipase